MRIARMSLVAALAISVAGTAFYFHGSQPEDQVIPLQGQATGPNSCMAQPSTQTADPTPSKEIEHECLALKGEVQTKQVGTAFGYIYQNADKGVYIQNATAVINTVIEKAKVNYDTATKHQQCALPYVDVTNATDTLKKLASDDCEPITGSLECKEFNPLKHGPDFNAAEIAEIVESLWREEIPVVKGMKFERINKLLGKVTVEMFAICDCIMASKWKEDARKTAENDARVALRDTLDVSMCNDMYKDPPECLAGCMTSDIGITGPVFSTSKVLTIPRDKEVTDPVTKITTEKSTVFESVTCEWARHCTINNCPDLENPDQTDTDSDGKGNLCDNCVYEKNSNQADQDEDSRGDVCDNCTGVANPLQEFSDADSHGNACDNCPFVANEDQLNRDEDSLGDLCDNCEFNANDDQADKDSDEVGDACDNCPELSNPNQPNGDSDKHGNNCDNCPYVTNEDQADADGDGVGDLCDNCAVSNPNQADSDGDGVADACDNCSNLPNATQEDSDSDGIGDVCDNCADISNPDQADSDGVNGGVGDLTGDVCDNCPGHFSLSQGDVDTDGKGDSCDNCFDVSNADQTDADNDGIGDACDDDETDGGDADSGGDIDISPVDTSDTSDNNSLGNFWQNFDWSDLFGN